MGTFADTLFSALMSWVRALVSSIWALFTSDHTTLLEFLGRNWLMIAGALIAAGLVIDWLVWLIRWQPYHIWARRMRRLLRIEDEATEEEEDGEEQPQRAHAAYTRKQAAYAPVPQRKKTFLDEEEDEFDHLADEEDGEADDSWLPLPEPVAVSYAEPDAQEIPDEELPAYPGMRYEENAAPREELDGTRRYAAVHAEGPGTAEVTRRRAEIDAWTTQMQEEARNRAEAELRARREEQERVRLQAEAERAAQEEEEAHAAQEEYERQLAQYELDKARYEEEMARYEEELAQYEAQLAAQQEAVQREEEPDEAQTESPQDAGSRRRRKARRETYSDYVQGEAVETLPEAPQWPNLQEETPIAQEHEPKRKGGRLRGGMAKVARLIEAEEAQEITPLTALPPRVDVKAAYRPAKKPQKKDS